MAELDHILKPKSIAVIGASRNAGTVGNGVLKNLLHGGVFMSKYAKPFKGKVYAINPKAKKILGKMCYPSVLAVKEPIDLAIICVQAKIVPVVMQECVKKKIKGAIIISAGFGEIGEQGKKLQDQVLDIAHKNNIRIVGPNCLGVLRMENHMNASFAPTMPPRGHVAFISQSGALADSVIDWAIDNRYGFSNVISYGNKADLDAHDFMEWLADDPETRVITLYIEGVRDGRKFLEVAKRVVKKKPVIALKAGRGEAGSKAISSHTGSMAGSFAIYEAAFKQSGIIQADTVEELFDLAKVLSEQPPIKNNSIGIITNGGGCGVLTADYCEEFGVGLAELTPATLKKLDSSGKMHPAYSRRNPLDIIGDALPERYRVAVDTLLAEPYISGLIVLQTLQTMTDPIKDGQIVIDAHKKWPHKPIICVYMGGRFSKTGIRHLEGHCIPDYNDPRKAAKAMWALIERGKQVDKIKFVKCQRCL
jgi:acetate---CoA ligase (ADP-forming)